MVLTLLVVECNPKTNWYIHFEGSKINGEELRVEQAAWEDILLVSYPNSCIVTIRDAARASKTIPRKGTRTVKIDFVFIRSITRGVGNNDFRNILLGFIHNNIPSVNSLESIYLCCERPTSFAALKKIQNKLGPDVFPLIDQTYYASHREMSFPPDFPIVCKIGHGQSGYGKMRIFTSPDFEDFRSVCGMVSDYVTAESFIEWDWDGRVQKIGHHYRAFKRTSNHWKGNVGGFQARLEEISVDEQMKLWVDECSAVFGGLDILGLDFVHSKDDDKFYILEVNDTAIGLFSEVEHEDMEHMRDLVMIRMQHHFGDSSGNEINFSSSLINAEDEIATLRLKLKEAREEVNKLKGELKKQKQETQKATEEKKLNRGWFAFWSKPE